MPPRRRLPRQRPTTAAMSRWDTGGGSTLQAPQSALCTRAPAMHKACSAAAAAPDAQPHDCGPVARERHPACRAVALRGTGGFQGVSALRFRARRPRRPSVGPTLRPTHAAPRPPPAAGPQRRQRDRVAVAAARFRQRPLPVQLRRGPAAPRARAQGARWRARARAHPRGAQRRRPLPAEAAAFLNFTRARGRLAAPRRPLPPSRGPGRTRASARRGGAGAPGAPQSNVAPAARTRAQVRISRIKTVLATRASTDTLAGLPGLLLTLAPGGPDIKGGGLLDAEPLAAQLIGGGCVNLEGGCACQGLAAVVQRPCGPGNRPPVLRRGSRALLPGSMPNRPLVTPPRPRAPACAGPPGCVAYAQGFQPYASNNIALDVVEAGEAARAPSPCLQMGGEGSGRGPQTHAWGAGVGRPGRGWARAWCSWSITCIPE